nr:hypothetical protein [Tanacetum cinerariifolium]
FPAAGGFAGLLGAAYFLYGREAHAVGHLLFPGLVFAQANAGELRGSEHAVGEGALFGRAARPLVQQVVAHHPKIVVADVRKLRPAVHVAQRIDVRHIALQHIVDLNKSFLIQLNAGRFQAQAVGIGLAASGHEQVAAVQAALALRGVRAEGVAAVVVARYAVHFGLQNKLHALGFERLLQFVAHVFV